MLLSSQYAGSESFIQRLKRKVKTPTQDFNAFITTFSYQNFVALVANYYWDILSPIFAGVASGAGEYAWETALA